MATEGAGQIRARVTRWAQEGRELLAALPALLEGEQQMSAKSGQVERENEQLRKDNGELRKEIGEARKQTGDARKELVDLHKALEDVKRENQQLRGEKDEVAQAFTKLLETVQSTNQIAQKLGVGKSPFSRPREGTAPAPSAPAPSAPAGPTPQE